MLASFDAAPDAALPEVARQFIVRFSPPPALRNQIQDLLWADNPVPAIPKRFRRELARALQPEDLYRDANKFDALISLLFIIDAPPSDAFLGGRTTLHAQIDRHIHRNPGDWSPEELFENLGAFDCSARRFSLLLEGMASSDVRPDQAEQRRFVALANGHLRACGIELRETGCEEGYPVFTTVALEIGTGSVERHLPEDDAPPRKATSSKPSGSASDAVAPSARREPWTPRLPAPAVSRAARADLPETVDVVLVVATDVERNAMLCHLGGSEPGANVRLSHAGCETYYVGRCGEFSVALLMCEAGSSKPGAATLAVADAISEWRPRAVIMPGIAFGYSPEKQRVGDVLVAEQVSPYELQRVGQGATIHRAPRPRASTTLINRFRNAIDWHFPDSLGRACEIRIGEVLSGDKLVDNAILRASLLAAFPNAIGGEMEGVGLFAAAERRHVPWLLAKAICDFGANKQNDDQPLAAASSASLVAHVLADAAALDGLHRSEGPSGAVPTPSPTLPIAGLGASSSDGTLFSDGAAKLMRSLAVQYVAAGFPHPNLWTFTPEDQDDPTFGELQAFGLLYFGGPRGGPWNLTQQGVDWIMRNRHIRAAADHGEEPRTSPTVVAASSPTFEASPPPARESARSGRGVEHWARLSNSVARSDVSGGPAGAGPGSGPSARAEIEAGARFEAPMRQIFDAEITHVGPEADELVGLGVLLFAPISDIGIERYCVTMLRTARVLGHIQRITRPNSSWTDWAHTTRLLEATSNVLGELEYDLVKLEEYANKALYICRIKRFLQFKEEDEWHPGMASGTGWVEKVSLSLAGQKVLDRTTPR